MKKGDRVVLTDEGIRNGLAGRSYRRNGIVTTTENNGVVTVHRLGDMEGKNHRYAVRYWRLADETPCA